MVATLALESALDTAIQGRQQQAAASNGGSEGASGGGVRNLAQELELIFKRDTGTVRDSTVLHLIFPSLIVN